MQLIAVVGRNLLLSTWLLAAGIAYAAPDCSQATFTAFLFRVQTLDKGALSDGQFLLKCPVWQEQAVQWQAFLLAMTGDVKSSRELDVKATVVEKDPVLARAKVGTYAELLKKVDDHDARYAYSAEPQLILARVLTRKGFFARGREAYQVYLKLRPEDDAATAESLYSWIWQGDLTTAAAQFAAASRWRNRPDFAAQVTRGQALIDKLRGTEVQSAPVMADSGTPQPELKATVGAFAIGEVYLRHSGQVSYQGRFDLRVAAHDIQDLALSTGSELANEVAAGFTYRKSPGYVLASHVGYFSLGASNFFGDAEVSLPLGWGITVQGGGYRRPLALLLPLTSDSVGLMRDAVYFGGRLANYAELHVELRKEEDYAPHEWDSLLLKWPFVDTATDQVTFRLPIQYFNQPQPNPEYDTYESTTLFGAGMGWQRQLANGWQVKLTADYSLVFMTPRLGGAEPDQTGFLAAAGDLKMPLNDLWAVVASGRLAWSQDPEYLRRRGEMSYATAGVSYVH